MARLQNDIVDAIAAIPGVTSAAFVSVMPMVPRTPDWDAISVEGRVYPAGEIPPLRFFKSISPKFFETSGTRLVAGRDLTWTDIHEHRNVVMMSENLARELWGRQRKPSANAFAPLDTHPGAKSSVSCRTCTRTARTSRRRPRVLADARRELGKRR